MAPWSSAHERISEELGDGLQAEPLGNGQPAQPMFDLSFLEGLQRGEADAFPQTKDGRLASMCCCISLGASRGALAVCREMASLHKLNDHAGSPSQACGEDVSVIDTDPRCLLE